MGQTRTESLGVDGQRPLDSALAQVERAFPRPPGDSDSPSARDLANRENARLSAGPKTPEGKARSSQNATKHGLTASGVTAFESSEELVAFRSAMVGHFAPQGPMEAVLLERLVAACWRLQRVPHLEAGLMDHNSMDGANVPYAFTGNGGVGCSLALSRSEVGLERTMQRLSEPGRRAFAPFPAGQDDHRARERLVLGANRCPSLSREAPAQRPPLLFPQRAVVPRGEGERRADGDRQPRRQDKVPSPRESRALYNPTVSQPSRRSPKTERK